jgi:LysM repeat protein
MHARMHHQQQCLGSRLQKSILISQDWSLGMQLNFQLGIRRVLPAYYILAYVFLITPWSPVEFLKVESTCVPPTGCTAALYYIVQQGDTLTDISNNFQTNTHLIQTYNPNIQNVNNIPAGNSIYIPFTCSCTNDQLLNQFSYSVQNNDNLTSIASVIYEGFTQLNWIAAASGVSNPSYIQVGQILHIPVNCTCGNPLVSTKYGFFATYVVKNVDTGSSIASKFNITESLLQQYNPGVNFLSSSILFVPAKDGDGIYPPFNVSTSSPGTSSNGNGVNVGVIVGPLVGALVLGAAIALGLYCCCIKNPRKKELKREQLLRSSAAHSQDGEAFVPVCGKLIPSLLCCWNVYRC